MLGDKHLPTEQRRSYDEFDRLLDEIIIIIFESRFDLPIIMKILMWWDTL